MMPYNPLAWNMTEFLELAWVDRRYERLGGGPFEVYAEERP